MGLRVERVDTRVAPEPLLREMWHYYKEVHAEELPEDPPMPFERQALDWRNLRDDEDFPRWLLRADERIVAVAVAFVELDQNLENGSGRIHVTASERGKGHARILAEQVFEFLAANHRIRVSTQAPTGAAVEPFLERLGMSAVLKEKRSRLVVEEVDRDLMESWVGRARERAGGYEILRLDTPFPPEVVKRFCDLMYQMNTAPLDDYIQGEEILTPDMWRDIEEKGEARQVDLHACIAVHRDSGEFAGLTLIETDRLRPEQASQGDTVVHPDHRNLGLGRWVKASLFLDLVESHPALQRIDTWNAGSNEPMLKINVEMGYRPVFLRTMWQGDLEEVRKSWGV
jgi:GNAT superfamily N-acetyltransferase